MSEAGSIWYMQAHYARISLGKHAVKLQWTEHSREGNTIMDVTVDHAVCDAVAVSGN